jgi:hypothetical protein
MSHDSDSTPPMIAWCSEVVKQMYGRSERFFILSMAQGEREVFSFQISETEARESYRIDIGDGKHACKMLADAIYNGWFDELKRRYG